MLSSEEEAAVIRLAVDRGLLSREHVGASGGSDAAGREDVAALRWGPRLDLLVREGRLTADAVEQVIRTLRMEQTQPEVRSAAALPQPRPSTAPESVALADTMQGDGAPAPRSAMPTDADPLLSSLHWDKYELLELIGRGGMGSVYRARDRRLGRIVALKFIKGDDPSLVHRFMQEARAQARLAHPNICKVYEVGTVEGRPYIGMEFISGVSLDKAAARLGLQDKVQIIRDIALAMHVAHEAGVIHRDLKPGNIMIEWQGDGARHAVVMDFGLARDASIGKTHGLTESGAVLGTPAYMSPEQARGAARHLDRRSDVYSLGATLYDILAGQPPFADDTVVNVILKVISEAPLPLRSHDPRIPAALEVIVGKCLNKEADQRYPSAQALADDLDRYLGAQRIAARRLSVGYRLRYFSRRNRALTAVAAALLASLLVFGAFGVRTRIVNRRKEELAHKEAERAQRLGQSVKDLEWLVRTAYLLPLHDTSYEKAIVQERMAEIAQELQSAEDVGGRMGAYALGRGYLALHDLDRAHEQLRRSQRLGYGGPELDYALGRVLGEMYSRALKEARRSGDRSFFEKRKKELAAEYLVPARQHLNNSRSLKTTSPSYVEALISYYDGQYDAALAHAGRARTQQPWLYEATKLEGDVYLARALEQRDRGDQDQAERSFAQAISSYDAAVEVGRSDYQVHEALAEVRIRQEEMDVFRGRNPSTLMEQALAAAERAIKAAPHDSNGYTKKAFAVSFQAQYLQFHGKPEESLRLLKQQLLLGEQAIAAQPRDAYAHDITGTAYARLAERYGEMRQPNQEYITKACHHLADAIQINPRFPWAYNDYALALSILVATKIFHNEDPQAVIQEQIRMASQALAIDPEYLYAYVSLAVAYIFSAQWAVEHGQEPMATARPGITALEQAIRKNKNFSLGYYNIGILYSRIMDYQLDADLAVRESAEKTIHYYKRSLELDGQLVPAQRYLAAVFHTLARSAVESHQDPSGWVRTGLGHVMACYRLQPGFAECRGMEARLRSVEADWLRQSNRPFLATLTEAFRLAQEAVAQAGENEEMLLILAEVALQLSIAEKERGQPVRKHWAAGMDATARALKLAVGWPRAMAVRGALLLLGAELETDSARKRELANSAVATLSDAFQGNPLLRRRYAAVLAAATQLAQAR